LKAKELYTQILTDVHNSQVKYTVIRQVKTILPKQSTVNHARVDKTQDPQEETQEKEKRKVMFAERQKQPKTTSWYCFKNMQYNDLSRCSQCFQIIEETMATK
jgi:hypothetical protein